MNKLKNNWEKEFREKYIDPIKYMGGYYWWKQSKEADPEKILKLIKSQKELSVRETLDRIELKRKEDKWNDNNSETWNVEFIDGYNQAVSDLNNLKKKIRDEKNNT